MTDTDWIAQIDRWIAQLEDLAVSSAQPPWIDWAVTGASVIVGAAISAFVAFAVLSQQTKAQETQFEREAAERTRLFEADVAEARRREVRAERGIVVASIRRAFDLANSNSANTPREQKLRTHASKGDALLLIRSDSEPESVAVAMWFTQRWTLMLADEPSGWDLWGNQVASALEPVLKWQNQEVSSESFGELFSDEAAERDQAKAETWVLNGQAPESAAEHAVLKRITAEGWEKGPDGRFSPPAKAISPDESNAGGATALEQ